MSIARRIRRPSPALIIACCALFVALGGTSYALTAGSIGSREIRDGSVRSIDVLDGTLRGSDLRRDAVGGGAIDEQALDVTKLDVGHLPAVPQAQAAERAALAEGIAQQILVRRDGRVALSRSAIDVDHLEAGRYLLTFGRDVSGCVPAATLTDHLAYGPDLAGGGEIVVRPGDEPSQMYVTTADSDDHPFDHDFSLIVSCSGTD